MNIDVHNHAFPAAVIELLTREPTAYGTKVQGNFVVNVNGNYADHELYPALVDPAAKLQQLEDKGLDAAVICAEPRLFVYHVDAGAGEAMCNAINRGLDEMASYDRARLRWMGCVPLQDPGRSAAMVAELARSGASGLEIGSSIAGRRLDDPEFEPFWAAVEGQRLPVFIHNAYNPPSEGLRPYYLQNVIGNPLETTICAERLICGGVLDRHPNLRIVLAHAGGFFPWQAGRLRHARSVRPELAEAPIDPWAYCGRLLFDTITHDRAALAYLVARVGPENVLMGTDLPYDMATPAPMEALRAAVDSTTARAIAEVNPSALYGF